MIRPICFVGALDRTLNVQRVRLACGLRAPPRIWTLLIALAGFLRQAPSVRTAELKRAVEAALALLAAEPGIREAEVFAAANRSLVTRLNYTSHIPCNGVEEPKSTEMSGLGLQVVFESESDGAPLVGFGSEPSDFGEAGVRRALDKAKRSAVGDPAFRSLPRPTGEARVLSNYHDPRLFAIDDEQLVEAGWKVIAGGLGAFTASSRLAELAGTEAELRRIG